MQKDVGQGWRDGLAALAEGPNTGRGSLLYVTPISRELTSSGLHGPQARL